jgi:hypothetical protein
MTHHPDRSDADAKRLPSALRVLLASEDPMLVALAEQLATLPSPDPLCPFCVTLQAVPWPDYASEKLCAEHLPVFRALQCTGWNRERWHQHLAGLARHGRLPEQVEWWPAMPTEPD